jgi:hypothetical protein
MGKLYSTCTAPPRARLQLAARRRRRRALQAACGIAAQHRLRFDGHALLLMFRRPGGAARARIAGIRRCAPVC